MPMRVGELMVVIRAQDFASRTLRRVGGEFTHMSRQQMIAARRADLAFGKAQAQSRLFDAQAQMKPLRIIERRNDLLRRQAIETQNLADAQRRLTRITPSDTRFISPGQRDMLREGIRHYVAMENQLARTAHQVGRLDAVIDRLPPRFQRAARSTFAFNQELSRSQRNLRAAEQGLNKAQRAQLAYNAAVRQMPINQAHDFARALGGIGRSMQLFGAIGTAAFGLAATQAADFSKSASLAATQVTRIGAGTGEAIANSARLRKEILQLADDYPFAAKEMAEATYEIFSSTNIQRIDQGMALLDAFARVAVAGQVDIETATKASITVLNTFKGAGDDVSSTLNRMFSIVRFGRMRFSDFADMLPKVAASAYGAGQSLDDVAGIMAFLTRKTGDASIAATQISRAFDVFGRKEFREGIRNLGVDIEDAQGRLLPLPEVLQKIFDRWGSELKRGGRGAERFIQIVTRASNIAGKGLLSTAEARRFFRFIFSDFELYTNLQMKVTKNNKEFKRSFETMMADPGVRWEIFINRMRTLITEIGLKAIPAFEKLGAHVANLLDWWERMSDSTQASIVKWGVFISVVTLLGGVLTSVISVMVGLGATFAGLIIRLGGGGGAGLIGRLLLFAKLLGFIAAFGVIKIGLELEQRGGGWAMVGEILKTGGLAGLLKKAGMKGVKAPGGVAAALSALIWPDETTRAVSEDFQEKLNNLDDTLSQTMKRHRAIKIQRAAIMIFQKALREPDTTFEEARKRVIAYLDSVGVSMKEASGDTKSHAQSWEQFSKSLNKALRGGDQKAILKALGVDPDSLAAIEQGFDDVDSEMAQYKESMKSYNQAMKQWADQLAATTKQAGETAVQNLRNLFSELQSVNEQAMGQLFQGPWLTGEQFDLAKEWGITPRIQDIIKDLDMQVDQFTKRRAMIDKLFKRGLPKEFLDELRSMTPEEAMPILQELIKATPEQTRKLIAKLNQRQAAIKKATMIDFTREINQFRKAGNDMGQAIIDGFADAGPGRWFDNWIKATFPNLINQAVAQSVAEWKKANPPPEKPQLPKLPLSAQPRQGQAPGTPTPTRTSTTNNNQKTVNVHMKDDLRGEQLDRTARQARKRKEAFDMFNTVRGLFP